MTSAVMALDATVGRIRTRALSWDPRMALLALLAVVPFVVGWSARMVVRALWAVGAHLVAALVVGWQAAARHGEGT